MIEILHVIFLLFSQVHQCRIVYNIYLKQKCLRKRLKPHVYYNLKTYQCGTYRMNACHI